MRKTQQIKKLLAVLEMAKNSDVINITPKKAMLISEIVELLSYQLALPITECIRHSDYFTGEVLFRICPICKAHVAREYQAYCDRCGQKLKWVGIKRLKEVSPNQDTSVKIIDKSDL